MWVAWWLALSRSGQVGRSGGECGQPRVSQCGCKLNTKQKSQLPVLVKPSVRVVVVGYRTGELPFRLVRSCQLHPACLVPTTTTTTNALQL
ncbi:hypothetical protein Pmani_001319 [Petrolisthes manimaculis]|uniref:Secreted protein n=1 Tax=Petrolisthes manimaculis TaxID=1843537 RepID=A0AAE1QN69_9EUCA|nr:hypothetical protein Pmani_001319 [Petrolisthes manimaculis]